jgi:2-polyprenyl-3-methyl-5-hydroxy-6-metoxy-1,4-benzoquinol methylase
LANRGHSSTFEELRRTSIFRSVIVSKPYTTYRQQQEEVNTYFQAQSSYWKEIYAGNNLFADIYRQRQAAALAWVDELALAPDSQVLEIGCGAGFLSVALAKRGLRVHAIDAAEAMVELTRQQAQEAGVAELVMVDIGDVYNLAFADDSFDLVIALGVIPWLAQPELAIREMARVTRFEGHILLTADNKQRLDNLLDPLLNPLIVPVRRWVGGKLRQVGLRRQPPDRTGASYHSARFINHTLANSGLTKIKGMTLGFGPFTFLRRKVFSDSRSIELHHRLQALADRRIPFFRSTGTHYLVLTKKLISEAAKAL